LGEVKKMRGIFESGFNLPPGCRVSDIPGNRPEDEEWENIYNKFWDKDRLTKTHIGVRVSQEEYDLMEWLFNPKTTNKKMLKASEVIDNYIMAAIEYGMEVGENKERLNQEENRFFESQRKELA
jgi:hypothetical protein